MNKIKLLISFFCLSSFYLSAQDILIQGKVLDADTRDALVGVSLFVKSDPLGGTYSDGEGKFTLALKDTDKDSLFVSYIGYSSRKIEIIAETREALLIALTPNRIELAAVEIKARRTIAEEFSVQTLKPLDIYTNPNAKADPLLAVQSMAASTTADETANVSLRGSPPGETGIYLNNVPIKNAVRLDQINGIGQFSIFNTGLIKSLHVFPSNPPLEFGAASSGAVVMNTSDNLPGNSNSISLNLASAGIYGSRNLGKKAGLTFYTNVSSQHGLQALNSQAFEKLKAFHSLDGGVNFILHLNDKTRFKLFNYTLLEDYEYSYQHPSFSGSFQQEKKRNMSIANFIREGEDNLLEANFLYDYSNSSYSLGNLDVGIKSQNFFASLNYHHFWDKLRIKTGLAFDHLQEDLAGVFPVYGYALAPTHPQFAYDSLSTFKVPEGFVYSKYKFGDFSVGSGARYHPGFENLPSWLSYQLNLLWTYSSTHKFILSGGKYHKLSDSNDAISPSSKIASQQLALEYQYGKNKWKWNSALYYKYTNYGAIKNPVLGAEVFASFTDNKLKASLSLAHIHSVLDDGQEVVPSSFDFNYFLRLIVKYKIGHDFEISCVYLNRQGQYFQSVINAEYRETTATWEPFYEGLSNAKRLPEYKLLDMSVSKILPLGEGSLILFLNANNVFNNRNIRGYTYNFNYSDRVRELYNQRVVFVGGVWSF